MRKLGSRLSIAAKTIYNYFHSQDELYLHLLIKGFGQLLDAFKTAAGNHDAPRERLNAMIAAYADFGISRANIYNLLFTWHVPKYNDYIGTPVEKTAELQLEKALECADFFMQAMADCLDTPPDERTKEAMRREMIHIWSMMHGYTAGINNTFLQYMHKDPLSLKQTTVARVCKTVNHELDALNKRSALALRQGSQTTPVNPIPATHERHGI